MKEEIFNQYVYAVCKEMKVDNVDFFAKTKKPDVVQARYLLYYLCFNRPMRTYEIQKFMSNNYYETNHSTIIRGIDRMCEAIKKDKDYANLVYKIKSYV
jgi:chromosomal replication initiation ATPase DnaA